MSTNDTPAKQLHDKRVIAILSIRLDGAEQWDVASYIAEKEAAGEAPWTVEPGCSALTGKQVEALIEAADERIALSSTSEPVARHKAKLRMLYARAVQTGDLATARRILLDLAELELKADGEPHEKLTPREMAFVDEYLKSGNATEAYQKAGYKCKNDAVASVSGFRLLRKDNISAYIKSVKDAAAKETALSVQWTLDRLRSIAEDEETSSSSRVRALELIGKHLGMFKERIEHSGKVEGAGLTDFSEKFKDFTVDQLVRLEAIYAEVFPDEEPEQVHERLNGKPPDGTSSRNGNGHGHPDPRMN